MTWRLIGFRYELLDNVAAHKKELDVVISCDIQFDGDSAIKKTGSLTLKHDPDIDLFSDQIRVWCQEYDKNNDVVNETSIGIFKFLVPEREINQQLITRKFQLYDQTQLLQDNPIMTAGLFSTTTDGNSVAANSDTASLVEWVVRGAGIVTPATYTGEQLGYVNVPANGSTFPVVKTWDLGTSRLEAVNYVLNDIMGYFEIYTDRNGVLTSRPIPKLEDSTPDIVYQTDDSSIFIDPISDKFDPARIWNRVLVIAENPSNSTTLSRVLTNDREDSPVSTTSIGRIIHAPVLNVQDINTQAQVDEIARIRLQQGAELYQIISFDTAINADHEAFNIIQVEYEVPGDEDNISGTFIERAWSMECRPGGNMNHTLHRIIPTEPVTP